MPASDSWGGPIACEPPFVEQLRKSGCLVKEFTYVYGEKEKPVTLPERVKRVIKTAIDLRRLLTGEKFDLIFLNTAFDLKTILRDAFTLFVIGRPDAPIFMKIHGSAGAIPKLLGVRGLLVNFISRRAAAFGCLSQAEKSDLIRFGLPQSKIHVVKNTIKLLFPESSRPRLAIERNNPLRMFFAARIIPEKGIIELIQAVKILLDCGYNVTLICAGDGPYLARAKALARELALHDEIHFTGHISEHEVEQFMINSDVFLLPSHLPEGFPIAVFKAAAYGLPLIISPIRASQDYFVEGVNYLECRPEPDSIASAVKRLIESNELMQRMNSANSSLAERFSSEIVVNEYSAIFEKLIEESK
jgi:glycosyltransferase involved in cell wall biosynthesis